MRLLRPESRFDPKLIDRANEAGDIMAQDLTQNFVRLRHIRLAAKSLAELSFDHREARFNVRPLVVVTHEQLAVVLKEVIHLPPRLAS
jgi:hypothetical protein